MAGTAFEGIIISNLGNINGRNEQQENRLSYIQAALKAGWHVCVDVVFHYGSFILPFDGGFNSVPAAFLSKHRIWARAYDAQTLDALCNINAHAFLHSETPTLTSAQFIWTPADNVLAQRSIAVFPEDAPDTWLADAEPAGLCSNYPADYI
jgi:hypothetical protein